MNKKQFSYYVGILHNEYNYLVNIPLSLFAGTAVYGAFSSGQVAMGVVGGLALLPIPLRGILGIGGDYVLSTNKKSIKTHPENYPLEHINKIKITDKNGLATILDKTRYNDKKETSTFLHSTVDEKTALVDKILNDNETAELGIKGYPILGNAVMVDTPKAKKLGFNGMHHNHPTEFSFNYNAINYAINSVDKSKGPNLLNLLSFNMPEGPELIAFNTNHTFLPVNKEKTEFVKATSKDIIDYLGAA